MALIGSWPPQTAGLWQQAQARSKMYSDHTTAVYNAAVSASGGEWAPGKGAIGPGTFVSTGTPPIYSDGA